MSINTRIEQILREKKLQAQELADLIGLDKTRVSNRINGKTQWSIDELLSISEMTGYSFTWIAEGFGPELTGDLLDIVEQANVPVVKENREEYLSGKGIRPVAVTVDRHGKELISYVPVRAQAGYMKGHADPHYIEQLPAFGLPILKQGTYRMFEVSGDSMLQMGGGGLHDGDIVIAQYLEDVFAMRDNRVYVVVSTDGVVVKRCLNRLKEKENPVLVCKSDNKNGQYPDLIIRPHQIIEVWELKAYISKQLSFATDIWQVLNDVQVQVALMDEKIKRIEEDRLLPG